MIVKGGGGGKVEGSVFIHPFTTLFSFLEKKCLDYLTFHFFPSTLPPLNFQRLTVYIFLYFLTILYNKNIKKIIKKIR